MESHQNAAPAAGPYAYLDVLTIPEFCWEFLRRNADYRRDYSEAMASGNPDDADEVAERWRLSFPGRSRLIPTAGHTVLAACGRCRHRGSGPGSACSLSRGRRATSARATPNPPTWAGRGVPPAYDRRRA